MTIRIKISTLIILLTVSLVLIGGAFAISELKIGGVFGFKTASIIQPVLAEEIYPLFFCPCCGQSLDKENICCNLAQERIDYIDSLAEAGASEDEIILAHVKKFGRLETSCGCTSASIVFEGKEGPKFNMPGHGINEKIKDWQVVIPAGKVAQLKVYYDPSVHKDFKGPAVREISIFSNDPVDFEKRVKIELNQVD